VHVRVANLSKTGLVIYSQGREDLIFNVSFLLKPQDPAAPGAVAASPAASGEEIRQLAWIIPVPSLPQSYGQVGDGFFRELDDLVPIYKAVRAGGGGLGGFGGGSLGAEAGADRSRSLLAYPPQAAGDYLIQPLRVAGAKGVMALKAWLIENGFAPMNDRSMAYYAEQGWTFLAIKVNMRGLKVGELQSLSPLRISFPTPRLVFPMKMAAGKVSATLFVLSDTPLPTPAGLLSRFGFKLDASRKVEKKVIAKGSLALLWDSSALREREGAYLYRYTTAQSFLSDGVDPSKFKTDVIFP
jgi:hypothetical protein